MSHLRTRSLDRRGFLRGAAAGALGIGLGAAGIAAAGAAPAPSTGRAADSAAWRSSGWMGELSADLSLDDITMPGAHNACALVGGPFDTAKCQDLALPELLNAGVRYLDVRCRPVDGAFAIHHGVIYQRKNFQDVLNECRDFLSANTGETLVLAVQKEHSDASDGEFADIFNDLYMSELGFDGLLHRESDSLPTLGEARGRIVLVTTQPDIGGLRFPSSDSLFVQNEWELPTEEKWQAVERHLDASAAEAGDTDRLAVNYLSTTGGELLPSPRGYAEALNPRLEERLNAEYDRGDRPVYGAVLLDFAGTVSADLPRALFRLNEGS
ncbi:phosphatidylinositol-specific phospholipase C [Streptomyces sp. P38-E01]|uniref:1-phosphatidylinositol phosphodiesterase n=1 Tax=Streptomyces tardus TaxID=2780544 RepID=A0A949N821_9ACTN|nr:phosphatidylinositol-specific phospholipase C [Streptomyces tardus]MBU7597498.1 phosphatidylinositol-specific phospholipase C [Streptomyces tardus]